MTPRDLPQILAEGGEIVDPRDPDSALQELGSQQRRQFFMELRETTRSVARDLLTDDNTFDVGRGKLGLDQDAVQSLATYFNLRIDPDPDVEITWEENRPFLKAHREGQKTPPGVAPVAEHCTATVRVHVVTPWGHSIERTGVCSSRGKHFWHRKGGQLDGYNTKKYREGAAHICAGIAETRATARAVKAALMLGGEKWSKGEIEERDDDLQRRKREQSRALELQQEYQRQLQAENITPEEEDAFREVTVKVPDEEEDWTADDYQTALRALDLHGRRYFKKCVRILESRSTGSPPPAEAEEDRDDSDAPEASSDDPDPETASETTQSDEEEAPEEEGEEEDEELTGEQPSPEDAKERNTLEQSIYGTTKLLGEPRTYAARVAGDLYDDRADDAGFTDLDDLTLEELEQVDRHLTEELTTKEPT